MFVKANVTLHFRARATASHVTTQTERIATARFSMFIHGIARFLQCQF
jgi:hypothetical protein